MIKAYEKRLEDYQFQAYLNYKMTDQIMKQIQAVAGKKDIKPTLSFDEWKKPLTKQSDNAQTFSEEDKERIREHTRNFGKGR